MPFGAGPLGAAGRPDRHLGRGRAAPGERLVTRTAQGAAAVLYREAAGCDAFVRPVRGIGCEHLDLFEPEAQRIRSDLRQCGVDALAELDLAGAHAHRAVFGELEPHAVRCDARSTARTMRLCAPQRHRCSSSAARTSASVGCGVWRSSAAAPTSIPELQ